MIVPGKFLKLVALILCTCLITANLAGPLMSDAFAKPKKTATKKPSAAKPAPTKVSAKKIATPKPVAVKPTAIAAKQEVIKVEATPSVVPTPAVSKSPGDQFLSVQKGEPVNITAASLSVNNESRTFTYSGGVVVTQGDLTLTCSTLDGTYNAENQIDQLIAKTKVTITKGPSITASGDRAIYDAKSRIVTLTDNPQLQEGESTLNADVIKIFLDENRSVAEGQVRMKLIKAVTPTPAAATTIGGPTTPAPGVILSPSPTSSPTPPSFIQRLM